MTAFRFGNKARIPIARFGNWSILYNPRNKQAKSPIKLGNYRGPSPVMRLACSHLPIRRWGKIVFAPAIQTRTADQSFLVKTGGLREIYRL